MRKLVSLIAEDGSVYFEEQEMTDEEIASFQYIISVDNRGSAQKLKDLFNSLPIESRIAFSPIRTQVLDAMSDNDLELALALVQPLSVSDDLVPIKNEILTLLSTL